MSKILLGIKGVVTLGLATMTALWGWFGWLVALWILLLFLDWVTGTWKAKAKGTWSSQVAREGAWHKRGAMATVLMSFLLDMVLGQIINQLPVTMPFTYTVALCPLVIMWYVLTEAGSIVENAGELGAPVPKWLRKGIAAFRDKVDDQMNAQVDAQVDAKEGGHEGLPEVEDTEDGDNG